MQYITIKTAAEKLGVSKRTIMRKIEKGKLIAYKHPHLNKIVIEMSDFKEFCKAFKSIKTVNKIAKNIMSEL